MSFAQGRSSKTVGDRQTNKMEHPSACEMTGVSTTTDGVESSSLKAISQSQTEGSHHQHVRWISQPDATDPVPSTDSQPLAQDNSGDPADSLPPSVANLHTPVLSWDGAATRIQSALRGYFARKRLQPYVQQQRAATKIQAAWYGFSSPTPSFCFTVKRKPKAWKDCTRDTVPPYCITSLDAFYLNAYPHGCDQERMRCRRWRRSVELSMPALAEIVGFLWYCKVFYIR